MNNWHQQGYEQGYADGLARKHRQYNPSFLDALNSEQQTQWEEGYDEGYADGEKERKENGDED